MRAINLSLIVGFSTALASSNTTKPLLLPSELTYLLPTDFEGNVSQTFLQTSTSDAQTSAIFSSAASNPFIAYDQEFLDLLATNATLELIASSDVPFADEMGIWVWDHNQVWMASSSVEGISYVSILDLSTNQVSRLNSSIEVLNPNGGYYHDSKVYIVGDGNATIPPCVYEVDPTTGNTSITINSYFGLRFNGPNDITWATLKNGKSYMFFTDDPLSSIYNGGNFPQLPDAVWRYDPQEKTLLPVIDRTDVLVPNGIRVNADSTKLFLTDTPPLIYGANFTSSSGIYVFDLDENGFPSNRRLFGIAERGIADGLHVDDAGRVWTGEADGIVVRNSGGKVIGMVNSLAVFGEGDTGTLQNFAIAGDRLIVLALDKIFEVRLSGVVVKNLT